MDTKWSGDTRMYTRTLTLTHIHIHMHIHMHIHVHTHKSMDEINELAEPR